MQDDFEELLEVNDEVQELMGRSYGCVVAPTPMFAMRSLRVALGW